MVIALFLSLLLSNQTAPAVCDQLTNEEVSPLIGPIKTKRPLINGDTCSWAGDQRTLTIMRTPNVDEASSKAMLEAIKRRAQPGDVVVDEPGIGQGAVSEAISRGQRVTIIGVAGTTSWSIGVEHVYGGLKATELLPQLRAIAKKIVR